jgi:hypothetical protein
VLFWGGIGVFVTTVVVVVVLSLHEKRRQRALLGPVFIMAAGALIFCGGAAWYFWPKQEEGQTKSETVDLLDNIVQLNCEPALVPTVVPQNKMFDFMVLHPGVVSGGSFAFSMLSAGSPIDMTQGGAPKSGWLCHVSNFGSLSIINIELDFVIKFSGPDNYDGKVRSPPFNLNANGGIVDIYVRNISPDHDAEIVLPKLAFGQMIGSDRRHEFKLAPSQFGGFILPSFKPVTSTPPTSVPLPPQRRR